MNKVLEVSVDSVASALTAIAGGATRLELCANAIIGGTTPSLFLFQEIRKLSNIPIFVLIRPRFGDFLYSGVEFEIMKQEVIAFRDCGANGIVIGMLLPDGNLDVERLKELKDIAYNEMNVTLHRAFDLCSDPLKALKQCIEMEFDTILTSGQKNNALDGLELIDRLLEESREQIEILVGSGVNARVIQEFLTKTSATSFHMSGKIEVESKMIYRNDDVSMGFGDMNEYSLWYADSERIKAAVSALSPNEKYL